MTIRLLFSLLLFIPLGCTTLPPLEVEGCGNGVINVGEDCDESQVAGATRQCGQLGTINACFLVCDNGALEDGVNDGAVCPDGYACGSDLRCRQPSGRVALHSGESVFLDDFEIGDVDGDGVQDLIGSTGTELAVRFGDGSGRFSETVVVPVPPAEGQVSFAQFTDDGLLDVLAPQRAGFFMLTGTAARSFDPYNYAPINLPPDVDNGRVVIVTAIPSPAPGLPALKEPVLITSDSMIHARVLAEEEGMSTPTPPEGELDSLAHEIARGDLDGDDIEEFVLAYERSMFVAVFTSTGTLPEYDEMDGEGPDFAVLQVQPYDLENGGPVLGPMNDPNPGEMPLGPPMPPTMAHRFTLPQGQLVGEDGARFLDIDMDNDLDLMVSVVQGDTIYDDEPVTRVLVTRNRGDGTFEGTFEPIDVFAYRGPPEEGMTTDVWPLASGYFDADDIVDYVFSEGVYLSSGMPDDLPDRLDLVYAGPIFRGWSIATTLDINRDGWTDIVAASSEAAGIDVLINNGSVGLPGFFNPFRRITEFPLIELVSGDFDGDMIDDIGFVEGVGESVANRLSVCFGSLSGGPSDAVKMGDIGLMTGIDAGSLFLGLSGMDNIADIIFLGQRFRENTPDGNDDDGPLSAALMLGDSSRKLLSPFSLSLDGYVATVALAGPFGQTEMQGMGEGGPDNNFNDVVVVLGREDPVSDAFGVAMFMEGTDGTGDVNFQNNYLAKLPTTTAFDTLCATWLAGDLGGTDEQYELIGVDCGDQSANATARLLVGVNVGPTLLSNDDIMPPPDIEVHEGLPALDTSIIALDAQPAERTRLELADFDADGDQDLLVVLSDLGHDGAVVILWNEDDCGVYRLCTTSTQVLRAGVGAVTGVVLDATAIQLDTDKHLELALFTTDDVFVLQLDADDDGSGGMFGQGRSLFDDRPRIDEPERGSSIRTADLNGDRLQDVVITQQSQLEVHLQTPREPSGAITFDDGEGENGQGDDDDSTRDSQEQI